MPPTPPPLPLGSFSVRSLPALRLTAALGPNSGQQPRAVPRPCRWCSRKTGDASHPPCQLLHPHPICTSSGMFYATQGSLLQLPLTGAQSLGPQAAPQPLGEGSQQWSLHSRSNAVPTTSDPKPFPAPGVALSPHSGGSSCSPLTCSCSAWAEPVPCAPLAVSAWSQVQKL